MIRQGRIKSDSIFLQFVNRSISAGWLILAVVLIRFLFGKASKNYRMILWGLVAVRLLCPVSIQSVFSLVPSGETFSYETIRYADTPTIQSGITGLDEMVNPMMAGSLGSEVENSVTPAFIWTEVISWIWIAGMTALSLNGVISFWKLKKQVAPSIRLKKNIFSCDEIHTAFILGILHPGIYLPSEMADSDMEYVICHERMHLKRRDHWWKPLGFLLLIVYWFQPVVWLAYILFCRDMELACDERVIKDRNMEYRKAYSTALLNMSMGKWKAAVCPLAFGEIGVKERIKQVLHYRKPAVFAGIGAAVVCVIAAVCFMTNPKNENTPGGAVQESSTGEDSLAETDHPQVTDTVNGNTPDEKNFEKVKEYLSTLPNDGEELVKAGCFVISANQVRGGLAVWNKFVYDINAQKEAKLVMVQFTPEGDALLNYLYYDGSQIYYVYDARRDAFAGTEAVCFEESFPYLKVFDQKEEETGDLTKSIVLTDDLTLTSTRMEQILASSTLTGDEPRIMFLTHLATGNENAEVTGNENWNQVAYSFDMTQVQIPREEITSIAVTKGNTGEEQIFAITDGSSTFQEILELYYALNAAPNEDLAGRSGYAYAVRLLNWEGATLQLVTPYKDAVSLNGTMYDCSLNGTSTQLLQKLAALEWSK